MDKVYTKEDIINAKVCIGTIYEDTYDEYYDIKDKEEKKERGQDVKNLSLAYGILKRAIPKEPVWLEDSLGYGERVLCCPNCRKPITNAWNSRLYEPNYCHYCGQSLEWD